LTEWLLSGRVLRPVGAGAGVANWLAPDGVHDALYPEIAGYYLQFLSVASPDAGVAPAVARGAASRIIEWLDKAGPQGDPLTLYHRDMAQSDWRNQCLFAFDLAMIVRGFASVESRWPGIAPRALTARYAASIRSLIDDARLRSHRLRAGAVEADIPLKWSTRIDVHHVKIAAALASLGPQFEAVVAAITQEQAEALAREGGARMRELHPFLYLVEGWLMLWGQTGSSAYLDHAAAAFRSVLAEIDPARGTLPPIAGRRDLATRSDVLAQALRAGVLLEHAGRLDDVGPDDVRLDDARLDDTGAPRWSVARSALEDALLSRLTPEGAIEFDDIGRHRNVWTSLFAWQALDIMRDADTGSLSARTAAASLI
jgi:hypothetical protein